MIGYRITATASHDAKCRVDALGVGQVWLVDWRDGLVEACESASKTRRERRSIRWRVPGGDADVTIDVAEILAGL